MRASLRVLPCLLSMSDKPSFSSSYISRPSLDYMFFRSSCPQIYSGQFKRFRSVSQFDNVLKNDHCSSTSLSFIRDRLLIKEKRTKKKVEKKKREEAKRKEPEKKYASNKMKNLMIKNQLESNRKIDEMFQKSCAKASSNDSQICNDSEKKEGSDDAINK